MKKDVKSIDISEKKEIYIQIAEICLKKIDKRKLFENKNSYGNYDYSLIKNYEEYVNKANMLNAYKKNMETLMQHYRRIGKLYEIIDTTKRDEYYKKLDGKVKLSFDYNDSGEISNWENGKQNGEYKKYHNKGYLKETGYYKYNKKDGLFISYYDTIIRTYNEVEEITQLVKDSIEYKNGKKNGKERSYYKNNQLKKDITWENDYKIGDYLEFYENGDTLKKCHYEDGTIHGEYKEWHANNSLKEISYYNYDDKTGIEKKYYSNGKRKSEISFKEDERNGLCKFWREDDGSIYEESYWINDRKDGEKIKYYRNGKKGEISNWKNGKKHGEYKQYSSIGDDGENIQIEGEYKNDIKVGNFKYYDGNGYTIEDSLLDTEIF